MTAMIIFLNITTDWIAAAAAVLALVAILPTVVKWIEQRKIPKETRDHLSESKRKLLLQPAFELYDSLNTFDNKLVKLKNRGAKASHLTVIAIGTSTLPTLKLDKHVVESEEAVSIFLGNDFRILPSEILELHIGFNDIEGRRYQQSYSKSLQKTHLASPILLVTRK